jgi:transposase
MRQKSQTRQTGGGKAIKDIRRATRNQYSAEEKIYIVLDGLRREGKLEGGSVCTQFVDYIIAQ